MKNNFLYLAIGLLAGGILVFGGMSYFAEPKDSTDTMHSAMTGMMDGLQGKTGDEFDRAFAAEMIVHHQGAIDMANAAMENANRSEIKEMAMAIIEAQTREIEQMEGWLESWGK